MLRAVTRTASTDSSDGLSGGATFSAIVHGLVLLALTFEFSFPVPVTHLDTIEIELVFLEPKREEVSPKEEVLDKTPLEQEDVNDEDSEQEPQTTTSSFKRPAAAPQISKPRSSDLAEANPSPVEKSSETEERKERAEPPQTMPESSEPTNPANLTEDEDTSLVETPLFAEVPGCNVARRPTSTRSFIDQIGKSAKTGRSYAQAAVHAQINGYDRKAIDLYDAAILARDLSQNNLAKVYNNRGAAYRSLGFHGLAIDDYNEATHLKPDYAAAYFNRGVAYSLNDQEKLAIEDFTRSIGLDSGLADPYYHRGVIYERQTKHEQAISDFSRAVKLAPCLDYAYFDRGRVFESTGDLQRALDDFEKSYALDPNNQDYKAKLLSLSSPQ